MLGIIDLTEVYYKCELTINAEVELSDMTFDSLMEMINNEEAVLA